MKISGAEIIIKSLLEQGVEVVFGYPGGATIPFYDALYDYRDRLNHILVRHEQGAAHAAEGYGRFMRKPGVCIATSGPGATNLVTGIADAMMDSVPMVCITGQVVSNLIGTDAFQETDVIGVTSPITKWNYQITKPEEIQENIAKAFYIANNGRPGPVLLDITKDAQVAEVEYKENFKIKVDKYKYLENLDEKQVEKAADLLNQAKRPLILVGHGVLIAQAEEIFKEFIEKGSYPVVSTLHGMSILPYDHPQNMGMVGMHGNYGANKLTNQADVILAVGMRFDDRVTGRLKDYAPNAKIIHIDIDKSEINKILPASIGIIADAKKALEKLIEYVEKLDCKEWIEKFEDYNQQEYEKVIEPEIHPKTEMIKMAEVVHLLSDKTKGEAVIVSDVGQHQMISAKYYRFAKPNSYTTSGGLGTMGYALPASIGAKMAYPQRPVVTIIGDGSIQMTIQELGTIAQEGLPIKIIILNNHFLGMVRQWQDLFYQKRYSFVEMDNPDFIQVAKGFGIEGEVLKDRSNLDDAMDRMLEHKGPYLLDIHVEKEGNVFPMVPAGFAVDEVRMS